jgi:hypothetical protein
MRVQMVREYIIRILRTGFRKRGEIAAAPKVSEQRERTLQGVATWAGEATLPFRKP